MDKFEKKLRKISKSHNNALVLGSAFGNLEKLLKIYSTVFVINKFPDIKSKNLIYRENFDHLNSIIQVSAVFFDLNNLQYLKDLKDHWQRNDAIVVIEGNDPIGREFSKPLYDTGWGCTSLQGVFHVWEKIK
jgi:urate oxidase